MSCTQVCISTNALKVRCVETSDYVTSRFQRLHLLQLHPDKTVEIKSLNILILLQYRRHGHKEKQVTGGCKIIFTE